MGWCSGNEYRSIDFAGGSANVAVAIDLYIQYNATQSASGNKFQGYWTNFNFPLKSSFSKVRLPMIIFSD